MRFRWWVTANAVLAARHFWSPTQRPLRLEKLSKKKMFWKSLGIWLQPVVYTVQYKPIKVIIADVVNRLLGTINDDATLVA